jgi:hypothetical protein
MIRGVATALIVAAASGLSVAVAKAGPCSSEIAWFEQAVRRSAGNPKAGPMAPQIDRRPDRSPADAGLGQTGTTTRASSI